jgi:DUF1680 family protein
MAKYRGTPAGVFYGDEALDGLEPWHGTETCAIVENMYSFENMIEGLGEVDWSDKLEEVAYNHLPGHMTPDGWNRQYHGQVNQVNVVDSAWGCNGCNNECLLYGNFMTAYCCCSWEMH